MLTSFLCEPSTVSEADVVTLHSLIELKLYPTRNEMSFPIFSFSLNSMIYNLLISPMPVTIKQCYLAQVT